MRNNTLILFLIQFISYLWNFILFVILLPITIVYASRGLDYFIFDVILQVSYRDLWQVIPPTVNNLIGLVIFSFGFLIIIESVMVLYQKTKAFPFTIIPHDELSPSEMVTSGWYRIVRHPMMLGYLLIIFALGVFLQSPAIIIWWVPIIGGIFIEYALMVEEKKLIRWFGDEYTKYKEEVPVLLPDIFSMRKERKDES